MQMKRAVAVEPAKAATPDKTAAAAKPAEKAVAIEVAVAPGANAEVAWNDYFASHPDVKAEDIRETARQLMHQRKFDQTIGMIHAALRNNQAQPWMYEAMSLAMQAGGSSKAEIERALMSAVDLGDGADDYMYIAQYMARRHTSISLACEANYLVHQFILSGTGIAIEIETQ